MSSPKKIKPGKYSYEKANNNGGQEDELCFESHLIFFEQSGPAEDQPVVDAGDDGDGPAANPRDSVGYTNQHSFESILNVLKYFRHPFILLWGKSLGKVIEES
jgi:hypothetical protein